MKLKYMGVIFLCMLVSETYALGNTTNIYSPWMKYANLIQKCQVTQIILPEPNYSMLSSTEKEGLRISKNLQTYQIHGWDNKKCIVSNKDHVDPDTITVGTQYCDFEKEDLNTVALFARDIAKNGQSKTYVRDYINVLKKSCTIVY